jgi:hypothetical protein
LAVALALLTLALILILLTWSAIWSVSTISAIITLAATLSGALLLQFASATLMLSQFNFPFG